MKPWKADYIVHLLLPAVSYDGHATTAFRFLSRGEFYAASLTGNVPIAVLEARISAGLAQSAYPKRAYFSRLFFARLTARATKNHQAMVASARAQMLPAKAQSIGLVSVLLVGGVASCSNQDSGRAWRRVRTSEQLFQETCPEKNFPNSAVSSKRSGRTSPPSTWRSGRGFPSAARSSSLTASASRTPRRPLRFMPRSSSEGGRWQ